MRYSIEPRTRKYVKGYGFLLFARNLSNRYKNQLLNTGSGVLKATSKKVVHKAAEATGEFIGNKIVKQKPLIDENSRNIEEIIKREKQYYMN